jgi:hypothetical protein
VFEFCQSGAVDGAAFGAVSSYKGFRDIKNSKKIWEVALDVGRILSVERFRSLC